MTTQIDQRDPRDQKLHEYPDLLSGIIESAMDAIIAINESQSITLFNAAAEKMFRCTADEAIGDSIERFIPARFRAEHSGHLRRFDEDGVPCRAMSGLGLLYGLRATGEEFPMEAAISKVESGGKRFFSVVIRDITERHRAEEGVRESEKRFRLVADTAPVLIWMSGTDKLCNYFNQPWLDFTGRSLEEELGNGWAGGVHPDDLQRCLDTYCQSFDRREKFRMEYRLRHRDGGYRWILDIGVPRFNPDGSFAGYIGTGVDINERKRMEEERQLSESRFRQFFETMPEYCYMVSPEGEIIDVNRQACATLGYSKDELVGKRLTTLYAPECHPKMRELFEKWRAGEELRNEEMIVITKQGQRRTVLLNVGSVRDSQGHILHSTSVQVDITERRRAEDVVRESEERFRLVADSAPVMIWMSGLDKKPTYFNKLWLDFTGLSETDLRDRLSEIVHPEDCQQCRDVYCRGFDQQQPFRKECRLRRYDGQYRWMLDIGVPRFHKDGSFAGYIGSCIDVTEHKLAQEAMSQMTRKLIEAQEQERSWIGRELHDDINQRLAILNVELEQLKENPVELGIRARELQKRVSEISNDVQALSHDLDSSKLEYLGVVAGMKSWCKEFAERQGMQIDCRHDVQRTLPPEIGLCLFRVLQEALHNAVKHSGVKRIEVELRQNSGEIHLIVRDSGRGFEVEKALQGKGLGLTSMRERIRLVNGTMTIQSKPMAGTAIHVRVPVELPYEVQLAAG